MVTDHHITTMVGFLDRGPHSPSRLVTRMVAGRCTHGIVRGTPTNGIMVTPTTGVMGIRDIILPFTTRITLPTMDMATAVTIGTRHIMMAISEAREEYEPIPATSEGPPVANVGPERISMHHQVNRILSQARAVEFALER